MMFPLAVSSLINVNQLIRYNNKLTIVKQYLTNIAAIQNMGKLNNKFYSMKSMGDITDMSQYHNAGIWSMD